MNMNKRYRRYAGMVGAVAGTLGGVAACGDNFASDCMATRTCAVSPAAGAADAPQGNDAGDGGGPTRDVTPEGGASVGPEAAGAGDGNVAESAGAGGAGGAAVRGCLSAAECSNGDASDGEERCDAHGLCQAGNPPPTVTAVSPADKATKVDPKTPIVISFSEPLDPLTLTSIQVLDGTNVIDGQLEQSNGIVTFTPSAPLTLLAPYTVSVTTGVTDEAGAPLLSAFKSTFSVRDGAWTTIDAVKDKVTVLSDALPISATGSVLLAWSGSAGDYCPVSARWFVRGAAPAPAMAFPVAGQYDCNGVSSGGNAAGVGAVDWEEPDSSNGSYAEQYRAGVWQATPARVSKNYFSNNNTLAVAPNGVVTFFEHGVLETQAWVTDASGKWPATGSVISDDSGQSRTKAVFDAKGNGLAVWRAKDATGTKVERIVASRFTSASGKWSFASDLPGSGSASTTPGSLERGVPVVAMDSNGDAMALWVNAASGNKLMASRFVQATGWAAPESISGGLVVDRLQNLPGLAFDGTAFVAAWTARDAGQPYTYTARYDLETGWGTYAKQQTTAADGTSAARMPGLVSDGRGNLLLVFATGSAPTFTFVYQRYVAGAWSAIQPISGGTITDQSFEYGESLPLSMSANGLAALAWADRDESNYIASIRLASFY